MTVVKRELVKTDINPKYFLRVSHDTQFIVITVAKLTAHITNEHGVLESITFVSYRLGACAGALKHQECG